MTWLFFCHRNRGKRGGKDTAQGLGHRLAEMRRKSTSFTAKWFAIEIDVNHSEVVGVEHGNGKGVRAKFQTYLKYTQFLGTTLEEAFTSTPHSIYQQR